MINAKELRVGNFIICTTNDRQRERLILKVTGLTFIPKHEHGQPFDDYYMIHGMLINADEEWFPFDYTTYDNDGAEPIPITSEILEAAGFIRSFVDSHPRFTLNAIHLVFFNGVYEFGYDRGRADRTTKIKYLHQLQNLYFALTGQELNVNLPSHAVK